MMKILKIVQKDAIKLKVASKPHKESFEAGQSYQKFTYVYKIPRPSKTKSDFSILFFFFFLLIIVQKQKMSNSIAIAIDN